MRVGEVAVPSRRQKQQRWMFRVTWGTAIVASLTTTTLTIPIPIIIPILLVTVRNPVDRILSWYYFLHPAYPPVKRLHHRQGCPDYAVFFRCWNSIQALSDEGLLLRAKDTRTGRREENAVDHTSRTAVKAAARCDTRLAWDMVMGKQQCWHNYFNYNVTYGPLLQQAARRDDDGQKQITIYTLRTEHLEEDWNEINVLLGGSANNFQRLHKNDWRRIYNSTRDDPKQQDAQQPHQQQNVDRVSDPDTTRTLSALGRSNLCRALCEEIQIYKKMLRLAVNLHDQHRNASLDELLRTCPQETRKVRTCPSYY